jgi:hypothetical protein
MHLSIFLCVGVRVPGEPGGARQPDGNGPDGRGDENDEDGNGQNDLAVGNQVLLIFAVYQGFGVVLGPILRISFRLNLRT